MPTAKKNQIRVYPSDRPDQVIDRVNQVLGQLGLSLVDDGARAGGLLRYELSRIGQDPEGEIGNDRSIADRILQVERDLALPFVVAIPTGGTVGIAIEPLIEVPSFDAVRLSLSVDPAPALGVWIDDLTLDGQTMMRGPIPAGEFTGGEAWVTPSTFAILTVPPAGAGRCKFFLQVQNRKESQVLLRGAIWMRQVLKDAPAITPQEIANTRQVARQLRRIADELDRSGGSLCARLEDPRTSPRVDCQTIAIERRVP